MIATNRKKNAQTTARRQPVPAPGPEANRPTGIPTPVGAGSSSTKHLHDLHEMCKTRSSILIILLLLLLLFQKIRSCKTNKVEVCTTSVAKSAGGEDFSNKQKGEFSMFSLHAPSIIANLVVLFVIIALIFIIHKLCCGNSIAKSLKRRAALETGERAAYVDKI